MWLWWEGSGSTDLQAHPPRSRHSDKLPPDPAPEDGSLSGPHQVEHPGYRPDQAELTAASAEGQLSLGKKDTRDTEMENCVIS